MSQVLVNDFSQPKLTNAFHASFHHAIVSQITEIGEANLGLASGFITSYKFAVETEQDIVNRTMGSARTELLRAQDDLRDKYFRAVHNVLRNVKYSSNNEIAALYDVIYKKLLKPYPASILKASDHTESSHLRGFAYDVKQFLSEAQLTALGIKSDLTAMETANEQFESIYLQRVDEYVQNPAGFAADCREKVDAFWATLVRTINYYSNERSNPDDSIKSIAAVASTYLDSLNKHIAEFLRSVAAAANNNKKENGNGNSGSQESGNSGTSGGSTNTGGSDNSGGNSGGSGNTGTSGGTSTGFDKPIEKDDKLTPVDNSDSGYKGDM